MLLHPMLVVRLPAGAGAGKHEGICLDKAARGGEILDIPHKDGKMHGKRGVEKFPALCSNRTNFQR